MTTKEKKKEMINTMCVLVKQWRDCSQPSMDDLADRMELSFIAEGLIIMIHHLSEEEFVNAMRRIHHEFLSKPERN